MKYWYKTPISHKYLPVITYCFVFKSSQRIQQKLERKKKGLPTEDDLTEEQKDTISSWAKKGNHLQKRLTILTASMTISFYFCWLPYAINCILTMSGVSVPHLTNIIATIFAKSGVVINPVIYIFFNKDVSCCHVFSITYKITPNI